jgi:hypothetical protein
MNMRIWRRGSTDQCVLTFRIRWTWVVSFIIGSLYRPSYSRICGHVTNWIMSEEWLLAYGIWRRSAGWKFTLHSRKQHRENVWTNMSDASLLSVAIVRLQLQSVHAKCRTCWTSGLLRKYAGRIRVKWQFLGSRPYVFSLSYSPLSHPVTSVASSDNKNSCLKIDVFWIVTRRILFICGLFNDAFSISDYMASRDWMIVYYK